jgi:hypothetical protein
MSALQSIGAQRSRRADPGVVTADRLESRPLFLVGAERSGTTLLRLLLDRHRDLSWRGEFEFAVDLISDDGEWPSRQSLVEHLRKDRVFNHWGLRLFDSEDPSEITHDFLLQWHRRSGKPLLGATIHRHLDRIPTVWPNARYIHILRDPRDVAKSMVAMGWYGNVWAAIDGWIEVEHSWDRLKARLSPQDWIEVRFEQLIRSPQIELARLCQFMKIEFEPSMMAPKDGSTYDAPDPSLVQQWRRKLSQRELRWTESKAGPMMAERGYEPTDPHAKPAGPLECATLRIGNRLGKARHNRRALGTRLWLESLVSKRMGSDEWRDSVRARVHAIAEANLK